LSLGDNSLVRDFVEWPRTAVELLSIQDELAGAQPDLWRPTDAVTVGGCFAAPQRGLSGVGSAGDPLWAGAAVFAERRCVASATVCGAAGGPYQPGLLALRLGPVLETAVRGLPDAPDVLLVDGTGRDHPRRAGLAIHLGAVLDLPTVGVTHRPLRAHGDWPADERGAATPLTLDGTLVGHWLRTRTGRRPLAVHAGWRTSPDTATAIVLATSRHRTPRPLREARRLAREARAGRL
jgi:deoxyribonuclease V